MPDEDRASKPAPSATSRRRPGRRCREPDVLEVGHRHLVAAGEELREARPDPPATKSPVAEVEGHRLALAGELAFLGRLASSWAPLIQFAATPRLVRNSCHTVPATEIMAGIGFFGRGCRGGFFGAPRPGSVPLAGGAATPPGGDRRPARGPGRRRQDRRPACRAAG